MPHTKYEVDGKRVKSVTTIIGNHLGWGKHELMAWTRKRCMNGEDSLKILKSAGNIGTLAHKMIEEFINTEMKPEQYIQDWDKNKKYLDTLSESEMGQANICFHGFFEWLHSFDKDVTFVKTEDKLTSQKFKYGGTIDCVCAIDGTLYLIDFKTSNNVYESHYIQVSAYWQLWNENYPDKQIKKVSILKLDKDIVNFTEHKINLTKLNWGWKVFKLLLKLEKLARRK